VFSKSRKGTKILRKLDNDGKKILHYKVAAKSIAKHRLLSAPPMTFLLPAPCAIIVADPQPGPEQADACETAASTADEDDALATDGMMTCGGALVAQDPSDWQLTVGYCMVAQLLPAQTTGAGPEVAQALFEHKTVPCDEVVIWTVANAVGITLLGTGTVVHIFSVQRTVGNDAVMHSSPPQTTGGTPVVAQASLEQTTVP
jgi:hypothetical protein